jgi:hypothetical protein
MIVGIDFDNTIACYDNVFAPIAIEQGLLPAGFFGSKKEVRDTIRLLPRGELKWQGLQGLVYGRYMYRAEMFSGVDDFLVKCHKQEIDVRIISHKTKTNRYDPAQVNLRDASLSWMSEKKFFDPEVIAMDRNNIFFEPDRDLKIQRIATTGCTHFVDDLIEVLNEPAFPPETQKILFSPDQSSDNENLTTMSSWSRITKLILGQKSLHDA